MRVNWEKIFGHNIGARGGRVGAEGRVPLPTRPRRGPGVSPLNVKFFKKYIRIDWNVLSM